ncbi:winged helix-turn-helix domain-containing protein [Sulfolobus sp. F1]|nr:winged helix-turn-helix domain-containing protein [Sulfolobus sp. F1]
MELTPRLQDIINIVKTRGNVNIKDLALEIKVSPKTAKGYARELQRLGLIEVDQDGNIKLKNEEDPQQKIIKTLEAHESEISALKKEIEALKEELQRIKKKGKV